MHDEDPSAAELFAAVRDAPVSPELERQLETRLNRFRSQLSRGEKAGRPTGARTTSRLLTNVGPLVGGLVAAAVLIAAFFSTRGVAPAWAQVAANVQATNWIHFAGAASDGAPLEYWVSLKERKLAVRDHETVFFDDARSRVRYEFRPEWTAIKRRPLGETASLYEGYSELFNAFDKQEDLAKPPPEGARRVVSRQERREVTVEGKRYFEYDFTFDDPRGHLATSRSVYRVDPETKLPIRLQKWPDLFDEHNFTFVLSYPETGPADIYALGVPKEAPVEEDE